MIYVRYRLTLQVTHEYENKMCGLCGNLNGNETDDGINLSQYMIPADRGKPYVFQTLKKHSIYTFNGTYQCY